MSPLVYIITLNWNNAQDTLRCLNSISQLSYDNYRAIVVDNGSHEDPKDILKASNVPFELIKNPVNLGYAGGNNIAIQRALEQGADYVWLLNNDAMTEPDTLKLLVAAMQAHPRIGMASPIIRYYPGGQIEYAGEMIDIDVPACAGTIDIEQAREWQETRPERMVLFGTALLVSKKLINVVGLFDEKLFAYWEDTDMSIRANMAGFRNITVFDACVYHVKPSHTVPALDEHRKPHFYYYITRNEFLLWRKHVSLRVRLRASMWSIARAVNKINRLQGNDLACDACLLGIWHGLTNRTGPYISSRRINQPWRFFFYHMCKNIERAFH